MLIVQHFFDPNINLLILSLIVVFVILHGKGVGYYYFKNKKTYFKICCLVLLSVPEINRINFYIDSILNIIFLLTSEEKIFKYCKISSSLNIIVNDFKTFFFWGFYLNIQCIFIKE